MFYISLRIVFRRIYSRIELILVRQVFEVFSNGFRTLLNIFVYETGRLLIYLGYLCT